MPQLKRHSRPIAFALVVLLISTTARPQPALTLFLPDPDQSPHEVIEAFGLTAREAEIAALPRIPDGWFLNLDTSDPTHPVLSGNTQFGSTSLSPSSFSHLWRSGQRAVQLL